MTQELPATYNTTVLKNWAGRWLKLPYQTFALQVCWITMRYYCHGYCCCYCCCCCCYDLWLWLWLWLHIVWSSTVLFSQSCLSSNPATYRHNTFSKIWAVPRMAGNCAFPKIFGRLNLPYQAFAFPEIVPSVPITMGFTVTLVPLWIFLISCASCFYFSTFFSSVVRILVRWHSTAISISVHSCVFECYSNIGAIVLQPLVR